MLGRFDLSEALKEELVYHALTRADEARLKLLLGEVAVPAA